ncbi:hypothetical protein mRhiFer1_010137 [Rhinolophus ferrumequinum]|uniref:non-specific serine/threonine protein kinase n=1 Tax=Rhinolophus ferrumequinum TaxID=59479 RepID=A0A7J7XPH8_RHIFE|nr:hypothetical protein mRhiFer1_010137 [Rhinolophus ferrumequinum]
MSHDFTDISVDQEPHSGHYKLLETTGKGSFAKVVLGQHILTGTEPNIIQLFHVINTMDSLFLVMELVPGGDMLDYLYDHSRMSEDKARGVFRQLVSAVQYCHQKGIAHGDLNLHNVLLGTQMNAKLADLGLRTSFNGHQLSTFCGNPVYTAPELFLGQKYDGPSMDIWS